MTIDFTSLLFNFNLDDPWLPPRPKPWESIPTESGLSATSASLISPPSFSKSFYDTSSVTETSLVRLAMNALHGLESSVISIEKLCAVFRSDSTDRTFHRVPSLWNRCVSTLALEKILRSLGCIGCEVLFLHKFIDHFVNLNYDNADLRSNEEGELERKYPPYSLVNQAFAVAVGDVLEGYFAALDTLASSVGLRRLFNDNDNMSCTILEVYLHTKELTTQIEVIGSICNVHNVARCFTLSPLQDLDTQTQFTEFPRGGNLLTYLYTELKVADPVHCALLKTLFIRSCEPYFGFIKSWIFNAKITDPFDEFILAETKSEQSYKLSNTGVLIHFPSATIREQDGVSVPCFLKDSLIPLFRAGQQLQVLIKLLEFSDDVGSWNPTSSSRLSDAFHMAFSKKEIETVVLVRRDYYKIMMEKLKNQLPNLEFKYHQVIPYSTLPISGIGSLEVSSAASGGSVILSAKNTNENLPLGTVECDASSMTDEVSCTEDSLGPSEWSSTENCSEDESNEEEKMDEFLQDSQVLENKYLSALEIKSDTTFSNLLKNRSHGKSPSTMGTGSLILSNNADFPKVRSSKNDHQEQVFFPNESGGGGWEILLSGPSNNNDIRPTQHNTSMASVSEIPLDFVLEKCLLEEIQLQYMYVSKLTIKLLEEGFSLQQHLQALRRYHMMESADWADLFIVSLSHRKWYATEADKRIPEIQGILELSVQRSSCQQDQYKDRLFVYMKDQVSSSLTDFATGIQSFNVIGLGYKVDWPVSIVLTPGALNIYAQIFSFLIKVKLALSSLTQVWCSFKEFIQFTNQDRYSDLRKSKSHHFSILVKLRHQIFHFVSTLQQYVQSQLSYVSWSRFMQAFKHKVKDLTDLELVHMDYLNDSLCICFLSNDMKQIADIIQSILQCALDFRCLVVPSMSSAGIEGGLPNVSQVLVIKEAFEKNIRQLYACYRNSPKNIEFSLPQFWEYLDYNHHYSDLISKQTGLNILSF